MTMSFEDYIDKYNLKTISGYTDAGGQCIDNMRQFMKLVLGINPYHGIPSVGRAKQIYDAADPAIWRKVPNGSTNYPPARALVIFDHGFDGHVAIARAGCTKKVLYSYDQNWTLPRKCRRELHDYTEDKVHGWLILR